MKNVVLSIWMLVLVLMPINALAEDPPEESMEELSKKIANPLAQIWNLSFQHNRINMSGDLLAGDEHISTTLFQPILPIPLGDKYTFFARPVFTYVSAPSSGEFVGGTPTNPIVRGTDKQATLGDTILPVGVGIARAQGWTWGAGATFIFPTSNHDLVGSHKYQGGPTGIVVWSNPDWLIGAHLQHWWDIANDGKSDDDPIIAQKHAADLNHTALQYFIIKHLPNAWQLRASPIITVNWEADSGNRWTVPIAFGVGKMIKLGPMPVQLMAELQYAVIAPDNVGPDLTIMLQANFVIKNPFGSL